MCILTYIYTHVCMTQICLFMYHIFGVLAPGVTSASKQLIQLVLTECNPEHFKLRRKAAIVDAKTEILHDLI